MRFLLRAACLAASTLVVTASSMSRPTPYRWGGDGHRIIAAIALARLSPAVASETRRLLGGQDITDVASWADAERSRIPATGPWHYVDIQLTDTSYVAERDCASGCVIDAVATQLAVLRDRSRPDSARATALKYVAHFIGDLHQPLHCGEHHDKGGNEVKVTFNGNSTNLHALWDSGLLLSLGQTDAEIVQQLSGDVSRRSSTDIAWLTGGTVASWAMESHDLARDVAYHNLPSSLEITPAYVDAARPVIYERLLRGGVRLGATLERALGGAAH